MFSSAEVAADSRGQSTAFDEVRLRGPLDDCLKLCLQRPIISKSALLQMFDDFFVDVSDQNVWHGCPLIAVCYHRNAPPPILSLGDRAAENWPRSYRTCPRLGQPTVPAVPANAIPARTRFLADR